MNVLENKITFPEWKLMENGISSEQLSIVADFIQSGEKLTYGKNIKKFEKAWSKWQGCKYSVFVNSGSSANLLAVNAIQPYHKKSLWVSQACTWSTTISPIILRGDSLQLCDVNLENFGPDLENLELIFKTQSPQYLFLVHLLGFNCYSNELQELCDRYNVEILEDCCEAHGASYNNKKVGNFGKISTFSFYYGHHMTTIEGGMVCTNDESLYERLLLLRSHGLMRELPSTMQEKYKDLEVDENFTFLLPGFNVRSTEINAVLGLEQLKDLDARIKIRNDNFNQFCDLIDKSKYECSFDMEGISNFCFPILRKDGNMNDIKKILKENNIHVRPIIAGNLYEHPFIKNVNMKRYDKNCSYINDCGLYVGNNHMINSVMVKGLCKMLEGI